MARDKRPKAATGVYERLRDICLALPETSEHVAWGHPNWKVGGAKIFASFGEYDGKASLGFKCEPEVQAALVATDPERYEIAAYVGKHGWVTMNAHAPIDWALVAAFVEESYRLIAPKKLVAQLAAARAGKDGAAGATPRPAAARAKKPTPARRGATRASARSSGRPTTRRRP